MKTRFTIKNRIHNKKSPPKKFGRKAEDRTVWNWQVVCFTEQNWYLLTSNYKSYKNKDDQNLYNTLREDFLPELSRLFVEKELVMRKRMMDKQLRRSRKDSPPPAPVEEQIRKQRIEQEEADRRLAEEIQRQERAAGRDLRERRGSRQISGQVSKSASTGKCKEESSGRMTNNSMSALLAGKKGDKRVDDEEDEGSAEEVEPKKILALKFKEKKIAPKLGSSKTKVKSSIIFSASEEDIQIGMHKVVEYMKGHRDAWPFVGPVDEDYAPNYYKVIREPMDLQAMEDKLDSQDYVTLDQFRSDFQLIVRNCHKYNGESSEYTEMVDNLEEAFHKAITRFILPDESDEEISIEYTATDEKKKSRMCLGLLKGLPQRECSPSSPPERKHSGKNEDHDESDLSPPPRKKRKKKRSKPSVEESNRSEAENSEEERRVKKKRAKENHKKSREAEKVKEVISKTKDRSKETEPKVKDRPKEVDPKDRPVKKRPRETTLSPFSQRSSIPLSKLHRHHHHHKHSRSHDRKEKDREVTPEVVEVKKVFPIPWAPRLTNHREKEERKQVPPSLSVQNFPPSLPLPSTPQKKEQIRGKVKKSSGSGILGFKSPSLLNMKRLQVGKATKFKIKSSHTTSFHDEKVKEMGGNGKGEELGQEKKRCLLLSDKLTSQRLSFGTILPKHALPLRDFKPNRSDEEEEATEPLPRNPTQEEILDRLEKTFGASLARTTKDQLAKVILAPDQVSLKGSKGPLKEETEENSPRLDSAKGFQREKSLPNLSAWFKAFGAPKLNSPTTPTSEKETEVVIPTPKATKFSLMGRSVGESSTKPVSKGNRANPQPPLKEDTVEEASQEHAQPVPQGLVNKGEDETLDKDAERKRRMSSSSMSSQSEVGSPSCFPAEAAGAPRWVENRTEAWATGSPASSQVSSQSPAGPNSPFSPPINSPPTPQTPPRQQAPVRVGFYQDYSVSHSSPEKTQEINVSSPATPPPNYSTRSYQTAYMSGGTTPSPGNMKQEESPGQSPQYTPLRTPNYDSGRLSKEESPMTVPQQQHTNYGLFPEAAHTGSSRYTAHGLTTSHGSPYGQPQAAHQYARETPPAYSHGRVGLNGTHYQPQPPAYTHQPPRPMNLYNPPNELFYKSDGLGLTILSTAGSSTVSTVSSTTTTSTGKSRKEKEPKQQPQVEQLATVAAMNGLQWPHNLASLTQIVNSIPNAMTGYMNAPTHPHSHYPHDAHGYTSLGNSRLDPPKSDGNTSTTPSPAPSGRRSTGSKGNVETKSSNKSSSKGRSTDVSPTPVSSAMVPGSAFNFSSLSTPELALYSKEMSEYSSQSSIPHAHHYSSNTSNFHSSFPAGGPSGRGSSYQLASFHHSPYQAAGSQNYSSAPRGMVDPYQGLFQGSPHVMGLLPPNGYPPPPYPHPHSLPFTNRPGWI